MSLNDERRRYVNKFEKYLHDINYPKEKLINEVKSMQL